MYRGRRGWADPALFYDMTVAALARTRPWFISVSV